MCIGPYVSKRDWASITLEASRRICVDHMARPVSRCVAITIFANCSAPLNQSAPARATPFGHYYRKADSRFIVAFKARSFATRSTMASLRIQHVAARVALRLRSRLRPSMGKGAPPNRSASDQSGSGREKPSAPTHSLTSRMAGCAPLRSPVSRWSTQAIDNRKSNCPPTTDNHAHWRWVA